MFGGSMFRDFEDPFYGDGGHFRQANDLHNRMMSDLFVGGGVHPAGALTDGSYDRDYGRRGERRQNRDQTVRAGPGALMPMGFGMPMFGGGMFDHMNSMMSNMQNMMSRAMPTAPGFLPVTPTRQVPMLHASFNQQQMATSRTRSQPQGYMPGIQPTFALMPSGPAEGSSNPNSHFYSSSTVMSYSNTGDGAPKVYQASSSTRQAPGGMRETRKMMRNSETGEEKLSVGRHMGDRGKVVERSRNRRTGDAEEKVDLLNIDDEEAAEFDDQWRRHSNTTQGQRAVADSRNSHVRARRDRLYEPSALEGAAGQRRTKDPARDRTGPGRRDKTTKVRLDSQPKVMN